MDNEKFGKFVCEIRKEKQLTQKQLADQLHLTNKAVSKWERGLSFPDISVLEKLSQVLDVSILELLCGEKKEEKSVEKKEVEELLADTMKDSFKKEKATRQKYFIIQLTVIVVFLFLLVFQKNIFNFCIGALTDRFETIYHTCNFNVNKSQNTDVIGCYVYEEILKEEEGRYNYHVMGIDSNKTVSQLFVLEETGMKLDRSPKMIYEEDCLYVLFEGLDNEDSVERIYDGKIGADPQAFVPYLYKYTFSTEDVEKIDIKNSKYSLLLDAFSYDNKAIYLSQQFKGIVGGLDLGLYKGEKSYSNLGQGTKLVNLIGDGGMKTNGCLSNNVYYIEGLSGIYRLDLLSGKISLIKETDLSLCYRSEIRCMMLKNGQKGYATVNGFVDEVGRFNEPKTLKTVVTLYDEGFHEINKTELDMGASSIEWGNESAIVSEVEEDCYKSIFIDFNTMKTKELISASYDEIANELKGVRWQEKDQYHLDFLDRCTSQWVYLHGHKKYVFTGGDKLEIEE
ncbi:helix-turn-helix transcriptional regulator [Petroclostridium sp. X23]|uniref:helix-turn-helix domain-containing protein n=1 Tax=Petroclostridium sp. X23 TaxID=3045146 RepID=UPI0024AE14C0|nr:helix-turn-helix transcriptional regulator [Petroclostridium sp. X23]WHH60878.1 helix-turn-helix transcriptional regulator [Petroclostridium sp. X23]